jgi:rod shape-determining protein MreD
MRNAAFIAIGILLLLLQGSLYRVLGPLSAHGTTPSLTLPLVIFLGVHEPSMARGALLAAALGYALDLLASAPIGLFTFVSVAVWWLSRVAGVRLTAQTALTRISLAFGFSLVEGAIVLTLLAIFGNDTRRPVEIGSVVLPHAIATALVAPFVFKIAQRLYQGATGAQGTQASQEMSA